ncbi:HAMP domain-containing sensor histidine kinase [Chamaesiphon sp. OTE_75_metabat_556]|uniref:sensor histidine kinase n=1 Tax=Chamaesiphon sp. OTE_75_metabat_556 TaxID=2964692 RepID=UPI00286B89C1|nr:HAMP domain-containing sensor histidine kinase [Chamaesiphon sp. OTE_75_metabat_556]
MAISFFKTRMWVGIFCGLIFLLEVMAPAEYVFGHLYFIPMLLTACDLTSCHTSTAKIISETSIVTKIGIFFTLIDLIVHAITDYSLLNIHELPIPIFVNKLNVVIILFIANWLIKSSLEHLEKTYRQKEEIDRYKAKISAHIQIDRIHQDFVYTLTHDLKTPLLGAIQTIKYFQQEKFGAVTAKQLQVLDMMSRSQSRSIQLVETLLDIYRNDAQGLILHYQPIDLCALAQETIDYMVILGLERQINLNLHCDLSATQPPQLMGDRLQLSRVFSNLLSNAIYHSPRNRQIDITIQVHDRQYIVQVLDRGRGINPVDLPFLFDRFYTSQKQLQGSGLGLYLSRQIVEAHSGKIWAESVSFQGAKFCFSLPTENLEDVRFIETTTS